MHEPLSADRAHIERVSTAQRVAEVLRTRVLQGYFPPGTRLSEQDIGDALGVSRNTLREAFRLLTHEQLLTHEFNRGVFVRQLGVDDVRELFAVRRAVELSAIAMYEKRNADADADAETRLVAVAAAVEDGHGAAARGHWLDLGTANMHFHHAIAALSASTRLGALMWSTLVELRLAFHAMNDPRRFHERYLARNEQILQHLQSGEHASAARLLADYLDDAECQLVAAYAGKQ